ncbi:inhibitor of Bruton tyrosine kinase-like [Pollicipes pollicipes]|uniref:inhibitor of Bruton tyrosine kinase-like n=1 Tax=Pollicipes pollicipes TaxID=41117 RepID=UPI001884B714|nr:inhibitor of Bruton tyrosine kinase-like [Pollicipes pollicipes]
MPERERLGVPVRCSECTRRCRSRQHADMISSAITKASDAELISYMSWLCHNAATGTDSAGRTPLHVAASCGRRELAEWLVQVHSVPLNTEDKESGMTALQRAVFYGQLSVARSLLMLGASPLTQDHADMTTYDGAHADRLPLVELTPAAPCEAYVWGSNPWFSIGVDRIKARQVPEPLDLFRRAGVWIKQIKMTKFHTVFLTQGGEVYTCGHGIGGRLGHGDEESVLVPKKLKAVKGESCVQVAASVDHTVLLMESGTVWTFGLNQACQLGHSPPPAQLTTPRLLEWSRGRADRITGVCAARYHTVFWNSEALYCVGLNGGQLGQHKDENKDKRFILPRKVRKALCVFGLRRELAVADAELDKHGLILISETGQAFTGAIVLPAGRHAPDKQAKGGWWRPGHQCAQVRVTRVAHIHRAVSITCDGSGGNAAAVQCDPRAFLLEVPQVSPPQLRHDLGRLLENADEHDSVHDIVLQAGQTRFACHRYILATGSSYLRQRLAGGSDGDGVVDGTLRLEAAPPAALRQLLLFLYTGTCDLLRPGPTEFSVF